MNSLKLGLASVTFRNKTTEQVVQIVKTAGISYIEWGADVHVTNLAEANQVRALCDKYGIYICSYGSYFRVGLTETDKWREICEIASVLGASSVRVWLGNADSEKTDEEEYNNLINECRIICDIAAEYSIIVSPECHDNTFNNNTDAFLRFQKDLQRENFRTYFQSRYLRYDYDVDRIERTYRYIENVHVSYRDLRIEQEGKVQDTQYLDRILNLFKDKSFEGVVLVEFTEDSSAECFYEDVRKLKNL